MTLFGVEHGEITLPPDRVVRAPKGADPTELRMAGKAVVLQDETVWVDRQYRGVLEGIDNNTEEIQEEGTEHPKVIHVSTRVRWYRALPFGRPAVGIEDARGLSQSTAEEVAAEMAGIGWLWRVLP